MQTVIALLVISSMGGVEEVYRFQDLETCQAARSHITETKSMCVSLKVRKPTEEMKEFFQTFQEITKEFSAGE